MRRTHDLFLRLAPAMLALAATVAHPVVGQMKASGPDRARRDGAQAYSQNSRAVGDACDNPIEIKLPDELIYQDANSTCGRDNDYTETCLGHYDGGEDIIYKLTVTYPITVVFHLHPLGTSYTALAVGSTCPPGDPCLAYSYSYEAELHDTGYVYLDPGIYFLMIDTWPSPDCIPEFTLTIDEGFWPYGACCLPDGTCEPNMWQDDCEGYPGGEYQGHQSSCEPNPCPQPCVCGDVDESGGAVDLNDFATLALCCGLGEPGGPCGEREFACSDLNGDELIDLVDFATFALLFGRVSTNLVPDCLVE